MRYPLANDANGTPLDVPAEATAWRIRRAGGRRGRPRNVYDPDTGRQLEQPLDVKLDDLIALGLSAGRYRLEAIDGDGRLIPGMVAFTEISPEAIEDAKEDDAEGETETPRDRADSDRLLRVVENQHAVMGDAFKALAHSLASVVPRMPEPAPLLLPSPDKEDGKTDQAGQIAQLNQLLEQAFKAWEMFQRAKGGGGGGGGSESGGGS